MSEVKVEFVDGPLSLQVSDGIARIVFGRRPLSSSPSEAATGTEPDGDNARTGDPVVALVLPVDGLLKTYNAIQQFLSEAKSRELAGKGGDGVDKADAG